MCEASRALLGAVTVVALAVMAVVSPTAEAGIPPPPPTNGFVRYDNVSGGVICTSGQPSELTFGFDYDATQLRSRPYHLVADYEFMAEDTPSSGLTGTTDVPIGPGTRGTYAHAFVIAPPSRYDTVFVQAHLVGSSNDSYDFASRAFPLSCPPAAPDNLMRPTADFSPVDCSGGATVTFDGTSSRQTWFWAISLPDNSFYASTYPGAYVHPGQEKTIALTGIPLEAGEVVSVQYSVIRGADSGGVTEGEYTLADGCRRPTVTVSAKSVPQGGTEHATGSGFKPGERVTATLHSKAVKVGSGTVDSKGEIRFDFTIPQNLPTGAHVLTLAGQDSDAKGSTGLTVTAGPSSPPSTSAPPLAHTGANNSIAMTVAVLLITAGTLALYLGRRRRRGAHAR